MTVDVTLARTQAQIAQCLALRWDVFVVEQAVPEYEERDGEDAHCTHVLALKNGVPVGAARFQPVDGYMKIQRVCVPKSARGHGVGVKIMRFMMDHIAAEGQVTCLRLGAQTHALAFYEALGFVAFGHEYLDAGIAHYDMEWHVTS